MVTRFDRGQVRDMIARSAGRPCSAVVLQEGVALLPEDGRSGDLPEDLRMQARVIEFSGSAIQAAIERL